jgi:hypothetical protein
MLLTCFTYFSCYFHILVFSQNCYLPIFFAPFLAAGKLISHLVLRTIGTPSSYVIHAPPYFWHSMHGFLEARRLWEPGCSLTTGKYFFFRLLPKVSGANVHWTEHNSYLSFSLKSLKWHFLAWPRPSQAMQYSSGMESPRDFQICE